jgi:hypothetical protein
MLARFVQLTMVFPVARQPLMVLVRLLVSHGLMALRQSMPEILSAPLLSRQLPKIHQLAGFRLLVRLFRV